MKHKRQKCWLTVHYCSFYDCCPEPLSWILMLDCWWGSPKFPRQKFYFKGQSSWNFCEIATTQFKWRAPFGPRFLAGRRKQASGVIHLKVLCGDHKAFAKPIIWQLWILHCYIHVCLHCLCLHVATFLALLPPSSVKTSVAGLVSQLNAWMCSLF